MISIRHYSPIMPANYGRYGYRLALLLAVIAKPIIRIFRSEPSSPKPSIIKRERQPAPFWMPNLPRGGSIRYSKRLIRCIWSRRACSCTAIRDGTRSPMSGTMTKATPFSPGSAMLSNLPCHARTAQTTRSPIFCRIATNVPVATHQTIPAEKSYL
ncbi:MAG: Uncharacterised protein [Hyphomonas sp. TMED17]|nr:MAG: Uncharacterised protein [Hyphomonas sp. TMED17]